jgi:hypothetical protein
MGPRTGLDDVEKRKILPLLGLKLQSCGHPPHSQIISVVYRKYILKQGGWDEQGM